MLCPAVFLAIWTYREYWAESGMALMCIQCCNAEGEKRKKSREEQVNEWAIGGKEDAGSGAWQSSPSNLNFWQELHSP